MVGFGGGGGGASFRSFRLTAYRKTWPSSMVLKDMDVSLCCIYMKRNTQERRKMTVKQV